MRVWLLLLLFLAQCSVTKKVDLLQKQMGQAEVQVGFARERHSLNKSKELAAAVQSYDALLEAAEQKLADIQSEEIPVPDTNPRKVTACKMVILWQSKLDMAAESLLSTTL